MKFSLKLLIVDIVRVVLIVYSLIYFLLALGNYFVFYRHQNLFYQKTLESITLRPDFLKPVFGDNAVALIAGEFLMGLILLSINFFLDSISEKLNVSEK